MTEYQTPYSNEAEIYLKQQTRYTIATVDKYFHLQMLLRRITVISMTANEFCLTAHFVPDAARCPRRLNVTDTEHFRHVTEQMKSARAKSGSPERITYESLGYRTERSRMEPGAQNLLLQDKNGETGEKKEKKKLPNFSRVRSRRVIQF